VLRLFGFALRAALAVCALCGSASAEEPPAAAFAHAEELAAAKRPKEAAAAFRAIALGRPALALGARAATRYLEIQKELAKTPEGTDAVVEDLTSAVPALRGLYCAPGMNVAGGAELCRSVVNIDCDLARLEAQNKIEGVRSGSEVATKDTKEGAAILLASFRRNWQEPRKTPGAPVCSRMEETLFNAAGALQAAGEMSEAALVRRMLVDPQNGLEKTALARRSVDALGAFYLMIGEVAEAVTFLDRFARESPEEARAPDALKDVVILRLALGQTKEAEEAADRFVKVYGAKRPRESAEVAFAIAWDCAERGDSRCVERLLNKSAATINRGDMDLRLRALALMGKALADLKKEAEAEKKYRGLVAAFRPSEMTERLMRESETAGMRRLGLALIALGEAHFFLAEQERRKVSAEPLPAYRGPADSSAVAKFMKETAAPALTKRMSAIEAVEKRYLKILEINPMPPPVWVIAASAQVAQMWIDTLEEAQLLYLSAKPEKGAANSKGALAAAVAAALEPLKARAKAASRTCLSFGVKFQFTSAYSKRCEAWLTKNFRKEFPPIEEIAPAPRLLRQGAPPGPFTRSN
jgi:tetratricopeptide (TPR) repeat protein